MAVLATSCEPVSCLQGKYRENTGKSANFVTKIMISSLETGLETIGYARIPCRKKQGIIIAVTGN
jgi:hypothetical protein